MRIKIQFEIDTENVSDREKVEKLLELTEEINQLLQVDYTAEERHERNS